MATKSILKTVHIKTPRNAQRLTSALENTSGKATKEVEISRMVSDASRDEIRRMFGGER